METTTAIENGRNVYRLISTDSQKPSANKATNEFGNSLIHSRDCRVKRWAEHFEVQYSWLTATMTFLLMPANEPTQMDTSPLSEMEVSLNDKIVGPHGLSPFVFKNNSEVLTL